MQRTILNRANTELYLNGILQECCEIESVSIKEEGKVELIESNSSIDDYDFFAETLKQETTIKESTWAKIKKVLFFKLF